MGEGADRRGTSWVRRGVAAVATGSLGVGLLLRRLNRVGRFPPERLQELRGDDEPVLLRRFPGLRNAVPWRSLGHFPTPVAAMDPPPDATVRSLLVKRDDLSSPLYGGNKVRKLEHLLAEAELAGCRSVVTLGGLGSNHALATALHGSELGFRPRLVLYPQPVTPTVEGVVRGFLQADAHLSYRSGHTAAAAAAYRLLRSGRREGERPYFINFGGSQRLGVLGYVGAALELAEQVAAGECPRPDRVFLPLGTAGTAAGLLAGFRLAGLPCRLTAVRVATSTTANRYLVCHFARDVLDWMRRMDPTVPSVSVDPDDLDVEEGYMGPGYGSPTEEGRSALRWCSPELALEDTYSAKAMAACLDHLRRPAARGEVVLFWHTCSAVPGPRADSLAGAPPEVAGALAGRTR